MKNKLSIWKQFRLWRFKERNRKRIVKWLLSEEEDNNAS